MNPSGVNYFNTLAGFFSSLLLGYYIVVNYSGNKSIVCRSYSCSACSTIQMVHCIDHIVVPFVWSYSCSIYPTIPMFHLSDHTGVPLVGTYSWSVCRTTRMVVFLTILPCSKFSKHPHNLLSFLTIHSMFIQMTSWWDSDHTITYKIFQTTSENIDKTQWRKGYESRERIDRR